MGTSMVRLGWDLGSMVRGRGSLSFLLLSFFFFFLLGEGLLDDEQLSGLDRKLVMGLAGSWNS